MSEDVNEKVKEKIFNFIFKFIPIPFIIEVFIYIGLIYGINKIFDRLIDKAINDNDKSKYLNLSLYITIISTIIFLIVVVITFVVFLIKRHRKNVKEENSEDLNKSNSKIVAYIIEASDDKARNDIYLNVNQGVQKSYKVYGTSLHSIANDHEEMLLKMAEKKVNIKLCMMNPEITEDELCKKLIESDLCVMSKFCNNEENLGENLKERKTEVLKNYNDPLNELKIYISTCYIKDYFNTATDYKQRLKNSYNDLKAIVEKIENTSSSKAEVKIMNSFIPISITIADDEDESGKMVVEFYIPYTSNRVLIELNKKQHGNLFEGFLEFYNSLWNQAHE